MAKKIHYKGLPNALREYANSRGLDFNQYSEYHMRLMDGGFNVLDIWTTGKYYALQTNYVDMGGRRTIERGGEKGWIPTDEKPLYAFLDKFFFAPVAE